MGSGAAEQAYALLRAEREAERRRSRRRRNLLAILAVAGAYLVIYLLGRVLGTNPDGTCSAVGWLLGSDPLQLSYLYGWLLRQKLFWAALLISALPALWGKYRFSATASIGFALGLVLGILLSRRPKLSGVVLPVLSVFNTIPGIVFIGLLVLAWGAGTATVLVALGIYATFPVLKNTYAGLVSVDQQYIEAARGCGMSAIQSLIRVELPLAMPTIIAGLRMAAIYTVSWAVLASMIGLGGLGDFVYRGTSSNNNTLILLGAIPAAILAVLFGLVIDLLQKRVTPRGLRKEAGK